MTAHAFSVHQQHKNMNLNIFKLCHNITLLFTYTHNIYIYIHTYCIAFTCIVHKLYSVVSCFLHTLYILLPFIYLIRILTDNKRQFVCL